MIDNKYLKLFVVLLAIGLAGACHASIDMKAIYFPERRPYAYESYLDLEHILDGENNATLWDLLDAFNKYPVLGAMVFGYADKNECRSSECQDLSLRRAIVVYEWFLHHGVSASHLKPPVGESVSFPLDQGLAPVDRSFNRRVQLEPFSVPEQPRAKSGVGDAGSAGSYSP